MKKVGRNECREKAVLGISPETGSGPDGSAPEPIMELYSEIAKKKGDPVRKREKGTKEV